MNSPKHTPEPWRTNVMHDNSLNVVAGRSDFVAEVAKCANDGELANAARIVACVNACAGLNPEAIPALVEAVESLSLIVGQADGANAVKVLRSLVYPIRGLAAALAAVKGVGK